MRALTDQDGKKFSCAR